MLCKLLLNPIDLQSLCVLFSFEMSSLYVTQSNVKLIAASHHPPASALEELGSHTQSLDNSLVGHTAALCASAVAILLIFSFLTSC